MKNSIGLFAGTLGMIGLLVSSTAFGDVSVHLSADRTTATMEDTIQLDVSIEGAASSPQPVLTHAGDFDVQSLGTSSQIQIINGQYSSSKAFHYLLSPKRPGTFSVGPAEVTIDGRTYQSEPVTLNVGRPEAAPQNAPKTTDDRVARIETEVSQKKPVVGEQIVVTVRFYSRAPIRNAELKPLEFEGFWKESLGDSKSTRQVINGESWEVTEIRWALFPISAGTHTIEGARLTADLVLPSRERSLFNDPFFNQGLFSGLTTFGETVRKSFSGEPVTVDVQPLPEEGRPADFSGLVGSFQLSQEMSSRDAEEGDSVTMTVTLKGDGNLRQFPGIKLPDSPDYKIYDDQPATQVTPTGQGITGTVTFRKAIVPLRAGEIRLPPFSVSYFDPKAMQYKTLVTGETALAVRPSTHPERRPKTTPAIADQGTKIEQQLIKLRPWEISPRTRRSLLGGAAVIGLGGLIGWFHRRRREKIRSDPGYLRRGKAIRKALRAIGHLKKETGSGYYEQASRILQDFIGDKATIDGRSLTPVDVARRLDPLGVSAELQEEAARFLGDCAAGLYGGDPLTEQRRTGLALELKKLVENLSREIRLSPR